MTDRPKGTDRAAPDSQSSTEDQAKPAGAVSPKTREEGMNIHASATPPDRQVPTGPAAAHRSAMQEASNQPQERPNMQRNYIYYAVAAIVVIVLLVAIL